MKEYPSGERFESFVTRIEAAVKEVLASIGVAKETRFLFPKHYDYPKYQSHEDRMPGVSDVFYTAAPNDYRALFRGQGLLAFGVDLQEGSFPATKSLMDWINGDAPTCEYFSLNWIPGEASEFAIHAIIVELTERYVHTFNTAEFDRRKFFKVLKPIVDGIGRPVLRLSVVIPIAITAFDFDHVMISEGCFIYRMSEPLQLARSRARDHGSGAHSDVAAAATHAFVSPLWQIENKGRYHDLSVLGQPSAYPVDYIDKFFAALRLVTQLETGYAQMLLMPRGWARDYYVDLPPIHGVTIRRYPSSFDNYGWTRKGLRPVTKSEAVRVGELFGKILKRDERQIQLAARRLNSCLLREAADDTLLDAMVGLEILLSDNENQAVAYKLAMRAAALAKLDAQARRKPNEVVRAIKRIYSERSKIVHGKVSKRQKKQQIGEDAERPSGTAVEAVEYLRYVFEMLLENPQYLDPQKLDEDLLLAGPVRSVSEHSDRIVETQDELPL